MPTYELRDRVARAMFANEAGAMMLDEAAFEDLEDYDKVMYHARAQAALNETITALYEAGKDAAADALRDVAQGV